MHYNRRCSPVKSEEVNSMNRLTGKHILITGASRGLGRQLAIDFAGEGAAAIAITARRSEDLAKVRDQILTISPNTRVATIAANLANQDDIERIVAATLSEFGGRLDV